MKLIINLKDGSHIGFNEENLKIKSVNFRVNKGVQRHLTPTGEKKLIVLGKRGANLRIDFYLRDTFDFKGIFGHKKVNEVLKGDKIEKWTFLPPQHKEQLTIFSTINSFYRKIDGHHRPYVPVYERLKKIELQPDAISVTDMSDSNLKVLSISGFVKDVM